MIGQLYEEALRGERCWVRDIRGHVTAIPVHRWLGDCDVDEPADVVLATMCDGPTIDLACGPGRFVARLMRWGLPALGVDESAYAVHLAAQRGGAAMRGDIFGPLPGEGCWRTVLLADGNVGIGGDPLRILRRSRDLLHLGGHCIVEFDATATGVVCTRLRLESDMAVGPWFPWATVGLDALEQLADHASLRLKDVEVIGSRGVAGLAAI